MLLKKLFLLDTNVLIQMPTSISVFEDNDVRICQATVEELDGLKNAPGDKGFNARNAIRTIYSLRAKGDITKGVPLASGGSFAVVENVVPKGFKSTVLNDDIIIATAKEMGAILVTNDVGMILKADIQRVKTELFRNEQVSDEDFAYTGRRVLYVDDTLIDEIYEKKSLGKVCDGLSANEFILLKGKENRKKTALAFYKEKEKKLELIRGYEIEIPALFKPKNIGQKFMVKALNESVENVPLVVIRGAAGTGKTMAALAAGLDGVEKGLYKRILLLRPNVKFDDDIGFLPGTEFEKIEPLLRPFKDNLEMLMMAKKQPTSVETLFTKGTLRAESLAYIRGRSIADTFIIVDEAQNSTPLQAKSIISRAGMNSKIVMLGDPAQIDNPKLNARTNGLVYAASKMRGSNLCMQLVLDDEECVRCPLALDAVKRL